MAVGFDLAHAVGNIELRLHDWDVDFAIWCNYKYLNSGPGSIGGCFVNEKYAKDNSLPRFAGWWGHDKSTRFLMGDQFKPIEGAEGWQISNSPILAMVPIKASLDIFEEVGMRKIRIKSLKLTDFLIDMLKNKLESKLKILTPLNPEKRGSQLSLIIYENGKLIHKELLKDGVFCDWREPNVIRIAPVPLYNSFMDCYKFVIILETIINKKEK